jgi:uncharacterized protein
VQPKHTSRPDPIRPPQSGQQSDRPLTLLLWDAPNMDMTLHEVSLDVTVVRPNFNSLTAWLCTQAAPSGDVEAMLFTTVPDHPTPQLVSWIHAARGSGFYTFLWPKTSGDIDPAYAAAGNDRIDDRPALGTLVLATHDQGLAGPLGDRAAAAGWQVLQLGFREQSAWVANHPGWATIDLEDVPSVFPRPLIRFDLDRVSPEGKWIPPATQLRPATRERPADPDLVREVRNHLEQTVTADGPVRLTRLGSHLNRIIPDYNVTVKKTGGLAHVVEVAIAEQPTLILVDGASPDARVELRTAEPPTPTERYVEELIAEVGPPGEVALAKAEAVARQVR